jgi:hypothetical protein
MVRFELYFHPCTLEDLREEADSFDLENKEGGRECMTPWIGKLSAGMRSRGGVEMWVGKLGPNG